jgi:hypothetical protein
MVDEEINEGTESGKKLSITIKLNKISCTKLILLIYVKTSSEKFALNLMTDCKNKNYPDGNTTFSWERFQHKYEPTPTSFLSIVIKTV